MGKQLNSARCEGLIFVVRIRTWIRWLLAAGGGVVVLLFALVWFIGRKGTSPIEGWIGSQLQSVAGSYLVPKLSFDDLDYQYPATVRVKHLKLTADDSGKPLDIVYAEDATITLGEIPREGQPIRMERIALNKARFAAVATQPGSSDFVGFSKLFRVASKSTARMSDVFQIRLIELTDGQIVYDPRIAGTQAMELDQINTHLAIAPSSTGTYALETKISRAPLFDLSVKGNLDLDRFIAQDMSIKLSAMLRDEQMTYLPPQLQKILMEHEVRGALDVSVNGSMPVTEPMKGTLSAEIALADANLVAGAYRVPLRGLTVSAKLEDGKVNIAAARILPRRGEINLSGWAMLDQNLTSDMKLSVKDVFIEDMLRPETGLTPPVAGRVVGDLQWKVPLLVVLAKVGTDPAKPPASSEKLPTVWGEGRFDLDQGLLVHLPLVSTIMGLINRGMEVINRTGRMEEAHVDQASVQFELTGDGARIDKVTYTNAIANIHGNGFALLDERLALMLKGGPKGLGAVSEALATYRVSGTAEQPEVKVEAAEGTAQNVENKMSGGVGAVKGGIEKLGSKLFGR